MRYEKSVAAEVKSGDTAVFYAYARSRTTVKDEVTRMILPDGSLTQSSKSTADIINVTF